jgi:CheY-like chemotaxis protein
MLSILSVSSHPEILAVMNRLVNKHDQWTGEAAESTERALELLRNEAYDIVLLGTGIDRDGESSIRGLLDQQSSPCRVIRHFGGGSGLLLSEIMAATGQSSGY